jgi:hypothetical protein
MTTADKCDSRIMKYAISSIVSAIFLKETKANKKVSENNYFGPFQDQEFYCLLNTGTESAMSFLQSGALFQ